MRRLYHWKEVLLWDKTINNKCKVICAIDDQNTNTLNFGNDEALNNSAVIITGRCNVLRLVTLNFKLQSGRFYWFFIYNICPQVGLGPSDNMFTS